MVAIIFIAVIVIIVLFNFFSWREKERDRLSGHNPKVKKFYKDFYNSNEYKEYEKELNEKERKEKEELKRKYDKMRDVF